MSNRKFLFLYLNTGAGHISSAKVLASAMKQEDPSVEIEMKLGFKKNGISRVFFEKGYNYACNYFHGAFPLIYEWYRLQKTPLFPRLESIPLITPIVLYHIL